MIEIISITIVASIYIVLLAGIMMNIMYPMGRKR